MEEWREIDGYNGRYEVSNLGHIRSVDFLCTNGNVYRGREISTRRSKNNGYLLVNLSWRSKKMTFSVHRLVANAFIDNPANLPQINHINEDKTDNRVENLEWCTNSYNCKYGNRNATMIQQRRKPVSQFLDDGTFIKSYESLGEASRSTGIRASHICCVCKGYIRKAGGYIWRYAE